MMQNTAPIAKATSSRHEADAVSAAAQPGHCMVCLSSGGTSFRLAIALACNARI